MTGPFQVLVASKDPENRQALTKVLAGFGLKPAFSESVSETREILARKPVSLIFCETQLADGGYQDVLRTVRNTMSKVPVVVASRAENWSEYLEALRLGAFDYLDGPYRAIDVELIVRYALRRAYAT